MGGQRNQRVRNHEVGLVARTRMCVYEKDWQERNLSVGRANQGGVGEEGQKLSTKQRS